MYAVFEPGRDSATLSRSLFECRTKINHSQIEPELPIDVSCQCWTNLPWRRGTVALPKGFSVGSPALCTYYGESQSVVGKHNLEIMKDN